MSATSSMYDAVLMPIDRIATVEAALDKELPVKEAYWKHKYHKLQYSLDRIFGSIYDHNVDNYMEERLREELQRLIDEQSEMLKNLKQ